MITYEKGNLMLAVVPIRLGAPRPCARLVPLSLGTTLFGSIV